jgi:SOS-response transcriptional repressor LexA
MKGIHEIRRENLLHLIGERFEGSQTKLADALGVRANYISRLCTSNKNIGHELARKLEYIAEVTKHWLDQDHAGRSLTVTAPHRAVPIVSWASVAKSRLREPPRVEHDAARVPSPVECSDRAVILQVKGVSMLPRFQEGDLIFVDPEGDPLAHSGFCLAMLPGTVEPVFRQMFEEAGRKYLRALNTAFPEQIIKVDPEVEILAAVTCKLEFI